MINLSLNVCRHGRLDHRWQVWRDSERLVAEGRTRTLRGAERAGARAARAHLEGRTGWLYLRLRHPEETVGRVLASRALNRPLAAR